MDPFDRPTASLSGIENRPLRQQIAEWLQTAILDGDLKPGQALVETDIASHLGVSRAPVREAMQILANRNLIETIPYRGTTVRKLTPVDVEEVYSLRTVLETFALRRVFAAGADGVVEGLWDACAAMEEAAAAGDWRALAAADDRFHRVLIDGAGHALLRSVWLELNVRVRQIMALRNLQNLDIMQIYHNHPPIVEAVADGDEARATALLGAHIASASELMLDEG